MDDFSCSVCYTEPTEEDVNFKCCDVMCTSRLCQECMRQYIDITLEQKTLLKCVGEGCKATYTLPSLKNLPLDIYKRAALAVLYHFTQEKTAELSDMGKVENVKKILLKEREQFYAENMPPAIALVAKTVFARDLKKIKKFQIEATKKTQATRICLDTYCKGYLDANFVCNLCESKFCKICEEKEKENHVCDENVKKSIEFVKNVVSCPNCGVKIEKGEGCMAVTCAVCQQNFWYNTGEASQFGNHGQSVPVKLNLFKRLSKEYDIPEKHLLKILRIETAMESKVSGEKSFLNDLYKLKSYDFSLLTRDKIRILDEFMKNYSRFYKYKSDIRSLIFLLTQLEKVILEGGNVEGNIGSILEKYLPIVNIAYRETK